MVVVEHANEILSEYQIKIRHDTGEDDALASRTDKFNHLLYEFERAETL